MNIDTNKLFQDVNSDLVAARESLENGPVQQQAGAREWLTDLRRVKDALLTVESYAAKRALSGGAKP